jgi:DNA-binding CsgD family transcriptional regulator
VATTLRQRDFERLLDAVASLQGSDDLDDLRHRAVAVLPTLVPNDRTAWNELDLATGAIAELTEPELELPDAMAIFAATQHSHPVIQHHMRTGDGRPAAISDFLTAAEFHETPIYRDFYRPMGAEDQLAATLPKPDLLVALAMNRSRRGFGARDRELFNRLRPHLALAYGSVVINGRLRDALAAAEASMERHGEGVVLHDGGGAVEYLSPEARKLLAHWFPAEGRTHGRTLAAWAAERGDGPLVVRGDVGRFVAHRLATPGGRGTAVLVRELGTDPDPEELLRRCGLSGREAEVVARAVRGKENRVIAAELFIGVRTVESHMRRALDKLGVANRTEAGDLVRRQLLQPGNDQAAGADQTEDDSDGMHGCIGSTFGA